MIDSSETNADLYYATQFLAPDAFIYVAIENKKYLIMSDLEIDRAKKQSSVDQILSLSEYAKKAQQKYQKKSYVEIVMVLLNENNIDEITVPFNFSVGYAELFRKYSIDVVIKEDPFFSQRIIKTNQELSYIQESLKYTEAAMHEAIELIRSSRIDGDHLKVNGSVLTSEQVKETIQLSLMKKGMIAQHTIVACHPQCADPHHEGEGPLKPNQSIIIDIFPRNQKTRYFADMTRTVVKGKASESLKKMYSTVNAGVQFALDHVKDDISGQWIHESIHQMFQQNGFETGIKNNRMQGFFHGTGHGVGLDIHELPRISVSDYILKAGHIVTVEPGLYYEDIGGVRIEDMIYVREDDCLLLTQYPKFLEV